MRLGRRPRLPFLLYARLQSNTTHKPPPHTRLREGHRGLQPHQEVLVVLLYSAVVPSELGELADDVLPARAEHEHCDDKHEELQDDEDGSVLLEQSPGPILLPADKPRSNQVSPDRNRRRLA